MFIKLSGCVFIFFSSFLMGLSFKQYTKRRLLSLENMLHCMQLFETEIRFSVNDIISSTEKILEFAENDNAVIFNSFLNNAHSRDGRALSEVWKLTVEKVADCVCYNKEDLKVLMEFGAALGTGDVETQIKNINCLCGALRENIDFIKNKVIKNDDVYSKMGIYVGMLLIIFLI